MKTVFPRMLSVRLSEQNNQTIPCCCEVQYMKASDKMLLSRGLIDARNMLLEYRQVRKVCYKIQAHE